MQPRRPLRPRSRRLVGADKDDDAVVVVVAAAGNEDQ